MARDEVWTVSIRLAEAQARRIMADAARRGCTLWRWIQDTVEVAVTEIAPTRSEAELQAVLHDPEQRRNFFRGVTRRTTVRRGSALAIMACWTVLVLPVRVIDGDTFVARLPIWHGLTAEATIRVQGIDTPERGSPGWAKARDFTAAFLNQASVLTMYTCRTDHFGRVLGIVSGTFGSQVKKLHCALAEAGLGQLAKGTSC